MDINVIKKYLDKDWTAVSDRIQSVLSSDIELLNSTNASILSHSGKQLRPLLSLLVARICSDGVITDTSICCAASSELLHNATLLHDDVADGSDKRRGVPTIRSLMGPSVSVLVGDYWLVKAMELILSAENGGTRIMRIFSKTLSDLAEGEMLQLQKAMSGDTDEDDYLKIIYSKTASLFEAACLSAAVSVNAPQIYETAAGVYATTLGIAFQIKDDILDYEGTESVGKPLGVDILEQKITLPLIGAMKNAGEKEEKRIRGMIADIAGHPEYRDEVVAFVKRNGGIEYAAGVLQTHVNKAIDVLDIFPDSFEKNCLAELARYTAIRNV